MNFEKIKSALVFFALIFILFYFGNMIARQPDISFGGNRSARFLSVVAVLDTINLDFDFINSFGNASLRTDVYIPKVSPSEFGRDNPFMKSSAPASFDGFYTPDSDAANVLPEYFDDEFEESVNDGDFDTPFASDGQQDIPPELLPEDQPDFSEPEPLPEPQPPAPPEGESSSAVLNIGDSI